MWTTCRQYWKKILKTDFKDLLEGKKSSHDWGLKFRRRQQIPANKASHCRLPSILGPSHQVAETRLSLLRHPSALLLRNEMTPLQLWRGQCIRLRQHKGEGAERTLSKMTFPFSVLNSKLSRKQEVYFSCTLTTLLVIQNFILTLPEYLCRLWNGHSLGQSSQWLPNFHSKSGCLRLWQNSPLSSLTLGSPH